MEKIKNILIPWVLLKPSLTPKQRTQLLAAIDVTLEYIVTDDFNIRVVILENGTPVSYINVTKKVGDSL